MKEHEKLKCKYLTWGDFCANFNLHPDLFKVLNREYELPMLDYCDISGEPLIPWDECLWRWCKEHPDLTEVIGIPGIYWMGYLVYKENEEDIWKQGNLGVGSGKKTDP